eukprot:15475486-Alexandrium_andersonii.AAC.1
MQFPSALLVRSLGAWHLWGIVLTTKRVFTQFKNMFCAERESSSWSLSGGATAPGTPPAGASGAPEAPAG